MTVKALLQRMLDFGYRALISLRSEMSVRFRVGHLA
jgi:hypothetical protein